MRCDGAGDTLSFPRQDRRSGAQVQAAGQRAGANGGAGRCGGGSHAGDHRAGGERPVTERGERSDPRDDAGGGIGSGAKPVESDGELAPLVGDRA